MAYGYMRTADDSLGRVADPLSSMRRLSIKAMVNQFFRTSPPSRLRTSTSIRRDVTPDAVVPLRAIWFSSGQWVHAPPTPFDANARYATECLPTSLALITWNVDFFMDEAPLRLTAALDYLQLYAFPEYEGWQPPPCLILLQEVERDAFPALLSHPWVQAWFMVVPGSPQEGWPQGGLHRYGTVTLIARSIILASSGYVHFTESRMGRNALVTDVLLGGTEPRARVMRVINTHLESLPQGARKRAAQFGVIARLLRSGGTEPVFAGGIVCGDMNAIVLSDAMLPEQNGLLDAWEVQRRRDRRNRRSRWVGLEGEDEDGEGVTWGYQPPCEFPPGRLDKILYTDSDAFEIKGIRRLGVELRMSTPEGRLDWVSDHYGLLCHVEVR